MRPLAVRTDRSRWCEPIDEHRAAARHAASESNHLIFGNSKHEGPVQERDGSCCVKLKCTMGRIILSTALAILSAGLITLAVIAELYPSALMAWPVWVWYALAGVTCVALSLTWIPVKPSQWPRIIGIKLKNLVLKLTIWGLQRLMLAMRSRIFRYLVFRPFSLGVLAWILWKLFTDPDRLNASGDPRVAELVVQIKAMLDKTAEYPTNDAERERGIALNRSMTWGVAGAALVLLTTDIVATHPSDKAALIAAACFAIAIPTLVVCGFIHLSHAHSTPSDRGIQPPTMRHMLKVLNRTYTAYFLVSVGMAAMLWSYDWTVSVVFIISLYLALRLYRRTVTAGTAGTQPTEAPKVDLVGQGDGTPDEEKHCA